MKTSHCTLTYPDFRLQVAFTHYPGDPGQTSGPPERCWPPEPDEFEFVAVELEARDPAGAWTKTGVDLAALGLLAEFDLEERLEEACHDALEAQRDDEPPAKDSWDFDMLARMVED